MSQKCQHLTFSRFTDPLVFVWLPHDRWFIAIFFFVLLVLFIRIARWHIVNVGS
jgi:hypothetical protein